MVKVLKIHTDRHAHLLTLRGEKTINEAEPRQCGAETC